MKKIYKRRGRTRLGFALVELIIVLVIAAILIAMVAPNIAGYTRAVREQNLKTGLDNLVGELQTQLPKSRYWNWLEVQSNAKSILESDKGRDVTDNGGNSFEVTVPSQTGQQTYTLDFTYNTPTGTVQTVDIHGESVDMTGVTTDVQAQVILKGNYSNYDQWQELKLSIPGYTTTHSGWKGLEDRVKTYGDWKELFKPTNPEFDKYKDVDFTKDGGFTLGDDYLIINVADYYVNTTRFINYSMPFYTSYDLSGTDWDGANVMYTTNYPFLQTDDGAGTGSQYAACGNGYGWENTWVYLGDISNVSDPNSDYFFVPTKTETLPDGSTKVKDLDYFTEYADYKNQMEAHGWFKYDDVLVLAASGQNGVGMVRQPTTAHAAQFNAVYQPLTSWRLTTGHDAHADTLEIFYRTYMFNPDSPDNGFSSRGYITVAGGVDGNTTRLAQPNPDTTVVYVDDEQHDDWGSDTAAYNQYETSTFSMEVDDYTYVTPPGQLSVEETYPYPDLTDYRVDIDSQTFVVGSDWTINNWGHEVPQVNTPFYIYSLNENAVNPEWGVDALGLVNYGGGTLYCWRDTRAWSSYAGFLNNAAQAEYTQVQNDRAAEELVRQSQGKEQIHETCVAIDMRGSGVMPGNTVTMTLTNINAQYVKDTFDMVKSGSTTDWQRVFAFMDYPYAQRATEQKHNGYAHGADMWATAECHIVDGHTVTISFTWRYNFFEIVYLNFSGALAGQNVGVDVDPGTGSPHSTPPRIVKLPGQALTITGDENYTIVTLDWSKPYDDAPADEIYYERYINYINNHANQIGIDITNRTTGQPLSYTVLTKDFERVPAFVVTNSFRLNQVPNPYYAGIMNDKTVHLYFNVGVDDLKNNVDFEFHVPDVNDASVKSWLGITT